MSSTPSWKQGLRNRYLRPRVGIELLTIDARIVIASIDTYLRFAEVVNRLDLTETGGKTLPELVEDMT
jgi:gas vesicle structural protein